MQFCRRHRFVCLVPFPPFSIPYFCFKSELVIGCIEFDKEAK
jgi:hypothetical protein